MPSAKELEPELAFQLFGRGGQGEDWAAAISSEPSDYLVEGVAYLCLDELLHPFTTRQAQPERSQS